MQCIFKLKQCGIDGALLNWFQNYLSDRLQRVVVAGQSSSWGRIKSGVPQGSVLGPLLFLIYINDVTSVIKHCNIRLFADDTCLFIEVEDRNDACEKINEDLAAMNKWSKQWLVSFSAPKTKSLIVSNKKDYNLNPTVSLGNQPIEEVTSFKYLGLSFTSNLRWNVHIDNIVKTALRRLDMMSPLKWRLDRKSLETMYFSFVLSAMEYANVVWSGTYDSDIVKLENVHVKGMRLITGATARSNISNLHKETGFLNFKSRFENNSVITLYKIKNCNMPEYLKVLLPQENKYIIQYNLRNREDIRVPTARLETFKH